MNTGGPAFPQPNHLIETDRGRDEARGWMADSGMTLLDWMAGQLAAAYIGHNGVSGNQDGIAREAYDIASAMLAEKARREADHSKDTLGKDHSPDAEKMAEINRELVEALEACEAAFSKFAPQEESAYGMAWIKVRSALAKAKGVA